MNTTRQLKATFAAALLALAGSMSAHAASGDKVVKFGMVRSAALNAVPACVPNAKATVKITPGGIAETMNVSVQGLPPNTDFDFFVIQVPAAPFGLSWYQGDIETDAWGNGTAKFIGRFSQETFIVAPGVASAPQTEPTDASSNPATGPIQTYHLGLWFNSPADAVAAGCPGTVTPFNGEHDAGVQVLNTGNFPDLQGPLLKIKP